MDMPPQASCAWRCLIGCAAGLEKDEYRVNRLSLKEYAQKNTREATISISWRA
jgi:hypothetical protein